MRTIHLEEESSDRTLLWVLAGTGLGVLAGILVAERMSGRKLTAKGLLRRGRRLALDLVDRGQELMEAASQLREAWGGEAEEEDDEELAEAGYGVEDEDLDEDDEEDDAEDDADEAEDEDDAEEEEAEDDDERDGESEGDADESPGALDERVLEAFMNDPVLSERAIEIESEDGTIDLHGRVRSAREVHHAVTIARGVPGVVEVRQRLRVRAHR